MNALAPIAPACAMPIGRTYTAWRVFESRRNEAQRLPITATSPQEAVAAAVMSCEHKNKLIILEHHEVSGKTAAHFYAVRRKSTARYVVRDHVAARVNDLYAEHLFSLAVKAFDPVEPWSWSPGCDVVGRDDVVDGRVS